MPTIQFDLNKIERRILNFWETKDVFKSILKEKMGRPNFVFYEGPPYANGKPGIHHFLSRAFKDIICRFRTMQGFLVERKAGWDTHGLPTEMEVEKILGITNKKEIEKIGIKRFVKECKRNIFLYKLEWEKFTKRMGYWLDLENAYVTCTTEYIETLWFILKKIWDRGLLYQDLRVSPYCPRCQTILSSHEVAQGYKKIKEPAIFVKLKLLDPNEKDTFLLVWTTTPWTLPGNVAVAVKPDAVYAKVKIDKEYIIVAKESLSHLRLGGDIVKEMEGKALIGKKYDPPFDFYKSLKNEKVWEVVGADFVLLTEGTGLVHVAPAFGEEDMELIKSENLKLQKEKSPYRFPVIINVNEEGRFTEEVVKWKNVFVKEADPYIIQDLRERKILFREELYEHDYPFCWRCKTPLLYYAKRSWFIRMERVKKDLIRNNRKINWIPPHLKDGRFGGWLKEVKDWALSRERYWGAPLPIWVCKKCGYQQMIGSLEDLRRQKFSTNKYILVRHGESKMNTMKILISQLPEKIPCPLTLKGKRQILEVAKKLKGKKIDLIISSDLLRARESAEILSRELGVEIIFDKRLRDIKAGIFEGKPLKEHLAFWKSYSDAFRKRPKGGENYNDVKMRMINFLRDIDNRYEGKTILILSHQRPLAMLEGALSGFSIEEFYKKIEPKKMKNGETRELKSVHLPYNEEGEIDLHRPYVDEVRFMCPKCSGLMKRVLEVIDCWFDSGAMPFAQVHWPFEQKQNGFLPPPLFPADFICEGVDQTRGWFYTLLAISTLLNFGTPYKNVISLGLVLDEKGEKMSKSRGNIVDPWMIMERYGADATRWYFFTVNQPGDYKFFSERELSEKLRSFILTLWNCFVFLKTYTRGIKVNPKSARFKTSLDRWILSRFHQLIFSVTNSLNRYDITSSARQIEKFVIEDLSLWYIRRSRKRFQNPQNKKELKEAGNVLAHILSELTKLCAPFIPFFSEYLYQSLFPGSRSVHAQEWPRVQTARVDRKLEEKMKRVREIVGWALRERKKAGIKIRQPLQKLVISDTHLKKEKELLELIKEEVNVKEIEFGKRASLDTKITPALKKEGILREIVRQVQQLRKEAGLSPWQKIEVGISAKDFVISILEENRSKLLQEAKIKALSLNKKIPFNFEKRINIEGETVNIYVKKL